MNNINQRTKGIYKSRWLLIFGLIVALLLMALWVLRSLLPGSVGDYKITEIKSHGNTTLFLCSLNDKGQAVGCIRGQGTEQAIIWDANNGITILPVPDGFYSLAKDINNSGEVCGYLWDPNSKSRACFWDIEGRMHEIGTLGGRVSIAEELNNQGQVVGWSQNSSNIMHAFLWTKEEGIMDLDPQSLMYSFGSGINGLGQVIGNLSTGNGQEHAFIWQKEAGIEDIHDKLKGVKSTAFDINNAGQVIGQYVTKSNLKRAFVWDQSGKFRDLGVVGDEVLDCYTLRIIDSGQALATIRQKRVKKFGFVFKQESSLSFLGFIRLMHRWNSAG